MRTKGAVEVVRLRRKARANAWFRSTPRSASARAAIAAVSGGNVAVLALGLFTGMIASRVLGPSLRGELVIAQTWSGVVAVLLTLGTTQAMVTFTGSDRSLRGTLLWQAILSIPTGLLLFLALLHFGEQWLTPAGIIGGAAMTASALITSLSSGMVQRSGRMIGAFQKVRLMPQACGALSFVLLWVVGNRDPNFWILASGVAFLAPCVILFIEQLGGMASIVRIRNVRPPPGFVRIAAGALAFAMGSQVIYRLDGVLVAIYLPTPQVAMYAVAVTAAGAVAAVGQSVGMTTFSRLRGISDSSLRRRLVRNGIIQTACITMALAIPIAITAPLIIRLLYGPDFEPAVAATRILVLAAVPLALDYLLSHALIGMRATSSVVRVQSLAIVGTTILLCLAIASASIEMVASVSLLVYSFSSALLSAVAYRRTRSDH